MNYYDYQALRRSVDIDPSPQNINSLGDWFALYGADYWNGEYYDADGIRICPIYHESEDGQFDIIGYEAW